ncbi:hypothetical protein HLB23_15515 [Nocardia uniformis]|uniref:Uncharacterized protein n=1 Tax=Nocardia uniformis TaxID=53432 RepID=A0A849BXJ4_9NOCA|nr:hypothetical protein [Nocardia uniformis]NNH71252.1 hypothetical protein [Nocardia uniformis]
MTELMIACSFPSIDPVEANQACADLDKHLIDIAADLETRRLRLDPHTQDLGATLLIVMSSPVVMVVVREVSKWLALRHKNELVMERKDAHGVGTKIVLKGPLDARKERALRDFLEN